MLKDIFKELMIFIALTVAIGTVSYYLLDGLDPLSDSTFDINIYDIYFAIANAYLIIPFVIVLMFIIYLTRMLMRGFSNTIINILFIVIGLLTLYCSIDLLVALDSYSISAGATIYPPLIGSDEAIEANGFYYISMSLKTYIFLVIILLMYCVYKMGRVKQINS